MDDRSGLLRVTSGRGLVHGLLWVPAWVATAWMSNGCSWESLSGLNRIASIRLNWWESTSKSSGRSVVTMGTVGVTGNDPSRGSKSWRSALVRWGWLESWIGMRRVRWWSLVESGVQIWIRLSRIRWRRSVIPCVRRVWRRCIIRHVPAYRGPSGLLRGRGRNQRYRLGRGRGLMTRRIAQLGNVRAGVTSVRSRLGNATRGHLSRFAHLDQVGRAQQQT